MTGSETDLAATATPAISYGRFAQAYAAGEERRFSETMARFALREVEQQVRQCRSVADVACGLGAACQYFAARGMRVTGIDASADMLHHARTAAAASGLRIDYLQQDMREFSLPEAVDLITCMYDSLNFMITRDDLRQAFQQARRALRPGGHYLFDMYTPRGLAECWGATDQIHTVEATHFVATRTSWNPHSQMSTKHLWGFDRDGQTWNRWEEQHTVRAYPLDEIETALLSTNFRLLRIYDWTDSTTGQLTPETTRAVFLVKAT